jgi:hypothetical protein
MFKHIFFFLFLILFLVTSFSQVGFAQDLKAEIYNPALPYTENLGDWGNDYVVSQTEPFGQASGVYRTNNSTIYVAIPDTNILANRCLVILRSTNNGVNWAVHASVQPAGIVPKTKMVARPGSDSVYCFFIIGASVYSWNVINNNFNLFTPHPNLRDFDVTISSTGSLYLIVDYTASNQVYWMGSANGGTTWGSQIFMSSVAARPRIYMSATGDTSLIIYYGVSILNDTNTSGVRFVRYRETVPGTMTSIVGTFTTIINAGVPKDQIQAVRHGINSWIFFTTGLTGAIDLNCIVSTNGGTTYGSPFTIGALPSRDEYWFDAKHWSGGVDLIYYSDSLQSGTPTNITDRMYNSYASNSTPSTFSAPVQFSEHPPGWSARGYIPALFEFYDSGDDAGAIWIGLDGANKRVYFDRFNAVVGVTHNQTGIPEKYSLSQNYPNPFNPATKIDFSLPKAEQVTLKLYDILGRVVDLLINKELKAGTYTFDFDASRLSSGIYFYELRAGSFVETRKMVLMK